MAGQGLFKAIAVTPPHLAQPDERQWQRQQTGMTEVTDRQGRPMALGLGLETGTGMGVHRHAVGENSRRWGGMGEQMGRARNSTLGVRIGWRHKTR